MFCPITPFQVVRIEKFIHKQGFVWISFFKTIVLSTYEPMLSSKLNVLSHISVPHCQIWKIPSQTGVVFFEMIILSTKTLCYLQNWMFCPITLFQVFRFEKFLHKQGLFFYEAIILSTNNPMLSSKLNISSHISVYLNIICSMFT